MFEQIDRTLNYGLEVRAVPLTGNETPDQVVQAINTALLYKRFCLLSFETARTERARFTNDVTPAGFYLFIAPINDQDKVIQAASRIDFNMYRQIIT